MPFSSSTLQVGMLAALRGSGRIEVATLASSPSAIHEAHVDQALRVAVCVELALSAIPIHYQNLCDRLRRRYRLPPARDGLIRRALEESAYVRETKPGVYQATIRIREVAWRQVLARWFESLAGRLFDGVYDLTDYLGKLEHWADAFVQGDGDRVRFLGDNDIDGWFEDERGLYRLRPGLQAEKRVSLPSPLGWPEELRFGRALASSVEVLDETVDQQLRSAEALKAGVRSASGSKEISRSLVSFADLWIGTIKDGESRGQSQRWRGWYLVPEHGALTLEKLRELQRILAAIQHLMLKGYVLVDRSLDGVQNCVALLHAGEVQYAQSYTATQKRDLFIRQQKNYLVRLGLVVEPVACQITPTGLGEHWAKITRDEELVSAFARVMSELRWPWCNMPFFPFTKRLAGSCEGHLAFREFFNWIIHAYDENELEDLRRVLNLYRCLAASARERVDQEIERKLRSALSRHRSATAFGHYRAKVRDIVTAFATTGVFSLRHSVGGETELILR